MERNIIEGDVSSRGLPPGDKPLLVFSRDSKVKDNVFITGSVVPHGNKRANPDSIGFAKYPEDLRIDNQKFKEYGAR